jgi:hypothetical protein
MYPKIYSQNDEQSIITDLLDRYQITKTAVEIGINTGAKGDGTTLQGNTVFLREKGWQCLWMDANTTFIGVNKVAVYPENINELLDDFGPIGIFSIDIDSEDWHVVRALLDGDIHPHLIVCELNSYLDPLHDLVMPLGHRRVTRPKSICHGATLRAFDNLLFGVGYNFICTTRLGNNGFWIHNDLERANIPIEDYKDNRHPLTTNWSRPNHTDVWTSSRELLA